MSRTIIDREHVGRLMHESWSRTKRAQGFRGPAESCEGGCRAGCQHEHLDLIPWDDLPEKQKDINRHAFDDVLPYFERLLADEREKVRETCAAVAKDFCDEAEPGNRVSVKYLEDKYGTLDAQQAIRQLDLTAPSSMEEEKGGR